jgi:tetratricopeptide (TPR) repeat protein
MPSMPIEFCLPKSGKAVPNGPDGSTRSNTTATGCEAYNNRGFAYWRKDENDRAIADYNEAIRLDPKFAKAYSNRGLAYRDKGDTGRAIADYTEAIRLDPKFANAYINRGLAYEKLADVARARVDFNATLGLSQNGTEWARNKAQERLAALPSPATVSNV